MKKLLAMVLALVMTLSLAVSANAAFKDVKDINETYAESAEVLANLGVFKGYEDGSFNPKGDITRAEVAAIVYRIYTGDVKDVQAKNYETYNKFADMAGAGWAKGYIGYCANAAFIKGYPDGNFKPAGKVTGYEALTMILRAVGYDKNNEFTGADWALNVAQIAQKNGILDNVKGVDLNAPATREVVAELLFRAINVPMVSYTAAFGYQKVGLSTADNKVFTANKTLGSEVFGLAKVSGEISEVSYIDKTTQFTYTENKTDKTEEVTGVDAGFENIGYEGYVWTVPGAKKTIAAVSTVYVTGESLGNSTNGTTYADLTDKDNDAFIAEDVDTVKIYKNGVVSKNYTLNNVKSDANKVGVKVDFVDNDHNGKTDVIVVTDYTVAQVAGIAKDTTTGNTAVRKNTYYFSVYDRDNAPTGKLKAVKEAALACDDELAVKDYVTFVDYNGATYVAKAGFVTDTFNRIKYDTVLGEKKVVNYVVGETEYLESYKKIGSALDPKNLNEKLDLYTDPYGHVILSKISEADVNYLYVLANRHTDGLTKLTDAKVVFSDGKVDTVAIKAVDGTKNFDTNSAILNHIYSYTVNTNESYTLKTAHTNDMTDGYYTTKTASWTGKVDGKEVTLGVNLNTKVIDLRDEDKIEVYTGYEKIPSLSKATICYITNAKGIITLAYLTDGINTEDLTANLVVYTTGATIERKDAVTGKYIYSLDVIADGEAKNVELTEEQYDAIKTLGVGEYYFNKTGALKKYISFDEKWTDNVSWEAGTIAVDNEYKVIGDEVNYSILDVSKGERYDLKKVEFGSILTAVAAEGKAVHAYLKYNETETALTQLYIVIGDQAAKTGTPVTGTNADKVYYVDNFKVTRSEDAEKVVDTFAFLRSAAINGKFAVDVTKGTGDGKSAATAYQLYATDCLATINAGIDTSAKQSLQVVAASKDMTINVYVDAAGATVVGTATDAINYVDAKWTQTNANWFVFSITDKDGNIGWFRADLKGLSNDSTVIGKDATRVKVEDTTIKVASNVANEQDSAADVLATLNVELNIPKGAVLSYTNKTLTVTPECGDAAHVTTYTVEFVTSISNQ